MTQHTILKGAKYMPFVIRSSSVFFPPQRYKDIITQKGARVTDTLGHLTLLSSVLLLFFRLFCLLCFVFLGVSPSMTFDA